MIIKNPNIYIGKGNELNIVFKDTAPDKTDSLWIKSGSKDNIWIGPETMTEYDLNLGIGEIEVLKNFGICDCGDNVYIFGGIDTNNNLKSTIYKYNKETNTTVQLESSLYVNQCDMICEKVGNKIYIIGGRYEGESFVNITDVTVLDTTNDTLSKYENVLTVPIIASGSVVKDDKIYLFGGYKAKTTTDLANKIYTNSVYEYNTTENTFTYICTMTEKTADFGCVLYGDNVYTIGGTKSKNIYKFSLTDFSTQQVNTLTTNFTGKNSVCIIDDNVYIVYDKSITKYNIESNTFEVIETLNKSMSGTGMCALKDKKGIYMFLGVGNNMIGKLVFAHTLIKDVVHIRTGLSEKRFNLVNTYNTMIKISVCDVYIGNSNNIAEKAEAYVYDTNLSSWVKI